MQWRWNERTGHNITVSTRVSIKMMMREKLYLNMQETACWKNWRSSAAAAVFKNQMLTSSAMRLLGASMHTWSSIKEQWCKAEAAQRQDWGVHAAVFR